MIAFLSSAFSKWKALGEKNGYYEECCHPHWKKTAQEPIPPLIPCHAAFRNDVNERPSENVMGAMGYYCTDNMTPIVGSLLKELEEDAMIICHAVKCAFQDHTVVYAITTHPGHHANRDNFGGYCYLNNAALCARLMQRQLECGKCIIREDGEIVDNYWGSGDNESSSNKKKKCRVAVIDVDYHCGNGTASIFYSDPSIFFTSIHCDPAIEYPFNQGYADQTGTGTCGGVGTTLHIPLEPGATWDGSYKVALEKAMAAIADFDIAGLVISLGLDTYDGVGILQL
jgi:acetoin utilization deacetylase AcuC-like enzyme